MFPQIDSFEYQFQNRLQLSTGTFSIELFRKQQHNVRQRSSEQGFGSQMPSKSHCAAGPGLGKQIR